MVNCEYIWLVEKIRRILHLKTVILHPWGFGLVVRAQHVIRGKVTSQVQTVSQEKAW